MRQLLLVVVAAALLGAPSALAMGEQRIDLPDLTVTVDERHATVDSSKYVKDVPAVVAEVETQRVDLRVSGPDCSLQTHLKQWTKLKPASCDAGQVAAPTSIDLVGANVALRFGNLAEVPAEQRADAMDAEVAAVALASPAAVALAAAAAGASAAFLYGVWRVLKWTGLAALIPLYSHITDDEILDDENRASIYRLIQAEAGISTKDIAERLGLAWGTVTHHLHKLEKRRFVVSKKYGKYRRFFANGAGGSEMKDQVAVLRLDRTGDVAALIQQQPGLTQKAVSNMLGVSSSTILWHVKRLEQAQLIRKERDGKLVRYYPGEGLGNVLVTPAANAA